MAEAGRRYPSVTAVASFVLVVCSTSTFAADAERGKQLARRSCSVCHVILSGQSSGVPPAPSFGSIAKSRQFRAKGARFLWEVHGAMPNFALTGEDAQDVAAYIRSFAK
jgi:mono/diheme cytochrome c family protein